MSDRADTRLTENKTLDDQTLGAGRIVEAGTDSWAEFTTTFAPTGTSATVLVDLLDGRVAPAHVELYRLIEKQYLALIPAMIERLRSKFPMPEEVFATRFKLNLIDIRGHIRPSLCVLHFRTDLEFDWYCRVTADGRVESCGEGD